MFPTSLLRVLRVLRYKTKRNDPLRHDAAIAKRERRAARNLAGVAKAVKRETP